MAIRQFVPVAFAVALLGGTAMVAPVPADAQSQTSAQQDRRGEDGSSRDRPAERSRQGRGDQRDWVDSYDPIDEYDWYILREHRDREERRRRAEMDERSPGGQSAGMMERHAREQFERGYQRGREDERRRRSGQGAGDDGRAAASGTGRDTEHYIVVPDILPDTPRYRGMQDFALIPDYSRSMDWLLAAAQSLREAVQALAQQPPSDRRDQAIARAKEALLETQQAMIRLPPEQRTR